MNVAPSIDTARAAWSAQRQNDNTDRRAAAHAIRQAGVTTLNGIAQELQARGILTPSGGEKWHRVQVARLLASANPSDTAPEPPPSPPQRQEPAAAVSPLLPAKPAMVAISVTVDHVYLPLDTAGNARADWKGAADTVKVLRGTRLQAPEDLAAFLSGDDRRQAELVGAPRRL